VSRRRRLWVALTVAGLLLGLLAWRGRRADERAAIAPAEGRAASAWVVRRRAIPRLVTGAALPSDGASPAQAALVVRAVDLTGRPIPGARVQTIDDGDRLLGATGPDGVLALTPAEAHLGRAGRLRVGADGYGSREVAYFAPTPLLVKLIPESRVSGLVVEAGSGAPVAGLTVRAREAVTESDAAGRFSFSDLAPGDLVLEAHGRGLQGRLVRPITVTLATVIADARLEVRRDAFAITGRVTAAGTPLAGIDVEGGGRKAVTDEGGRYRLTDLPAGAYQVQATTGFLNVAPAVNVTLRGQDAVADLELGPRVTLVGEVADVAGRPVAQHEVMLEQAADGSQVGLGAETDATGRFRFEGLLPTRAKLSGRALESQDVDLSRPRARPVRLLLSPTGRLQGVVKAPPGTSIADRMVHATEVQSASEFSAGSEADGSFAFGAVPPGRYTLEIRSGRARNSANPPEARADGVMVRAGATTEVTLEVAADDGVLAGRVLDARGAPVDDALVIYFQRGLRVFAAGSQALGGGVDAAVTGPDGAFRFTGVRRNQLLEIEARTRAGQHGRAEVTGSEVVVRLGE
jgi:protocatechuate 3,4-dioxygenase beta subunit